MRGERRKQWQQDVWLINLCPMALRAFIYEISVGSVSTAVRMATLHLHAFNTDASSYKEINTGLRGKMTHSPGGPENTH